MLDRGFEFYDRTATRDGGIAEPLFFKVHAIPQDASSARLAAARMQANAARAIEAGLGRKSAARPPALYAYDPDIGRLAVTTPAYNTAIDNVDVPFPSTGRGQARVTAVLKDGSRVTVGDKRIPLAGVARLEVASRYGGYTVAPLTRPKGAAVHVMRPAPQSSAPDPGPMLAVQLERSARFTRTALTARITPAK